MADEAPPLDCALDRVADHARRHGGSDGADGPETRRWWPQKAAIRLAYDEHQATIRRDVAVVVLGRR